MRSWWLCIVLCLGIGPVLSAGPYRSADAWAAELAALGPVEVVVVEQGPSRAMAATLAVVLGPFGAHRLYLGTEAKVPVLYGLTFGAFGILPLIDLAHILFTKDLASYQANGHILMWAKEGPDGSSITPP